MDSDDLNKAIVAGIKFYEARFWGDLISRN